MSAAFATLCNREIILPLEPSADDGAIGQPVAPVQIGDLVEIYHIDQDNSSIEQDGIPDIWRSGFLESE